MKDYYELVKSIMEKYPDTRDDDMRLYAIVVHQKTRLKPDTAFYEAMYNHSRYDLPSYESVTRARRKVQEQIEALRGKKYNDRKKRQEEYREHYMRPEDFVG
mgnify:CR=1 FL=1